ncbi:MAG: cadmium-translocating P-type ATPase [Oscillospiraceae bacterium]|nr:cadmium-translocating P-type ATPase [Oscillospiraceae bacterium]
MTKKQKKTLIRIVSAAVLTVIAALIPLDGIWKGLAFAVPYLVIGWDVLWSAVRNIAHGQVFDEKFLMAVATLGAFAIREYPEAAAVMLFYQIGEWFQSIAVGKSRKSIAALMDIRPEYAVVLREGKEQEVDPEEVEMGEIIVLKPGERIPLDGTVIEGAGSVDTSALTGESLPADKTVGDTVLSGSINLSGVLKVKTSSEYAESTVARILELVENSSEKKARIENFITRFARWYTPLVVISAVLLAVIPPLFLSGSWADWINRALIFLVVSCPCALVVSVPLSFFGGIGGASRDGILVKGANYLEMLSKADTVVFDKTGTLTQGSFAVDAVHPSEISAEELLDIAAAAESYSSHPIAESVVSAFAGDIDRSRIGEIKEIAGMGIEAQVDGKTFFLGNGKLMEKAGAVWHECHLPGTAIHISEDSSYMGHIIINDQIKPEVRESINKLKELGIKQTLMLTGDSEKVAKAVAEKIGVDSYRAELLPAQKVTAVEDLLGSGAHVAFVGDGINDAPVLSRADVGIAMGALGSDAAIESADIVIMDDRISRLPLAIKIAHRTMRIVHENIILALGVKFAILILSAFGLTNMWWAVFGDVGVLIVAVLNAMRCMIRVKE